MSRLQAYSYAFAIVVGIILPQLRSADPLVLEWCAPQGRYDRPRSNADPSFIRGSSRFWQFLAKRIKGEEGEFIPGRMNMPATALQVPSEFVTKWQEIVDNLRKVFALAIPLATSTDEPIIGHSGLR